jgi:hypothetical protein
LTTGISIRLKPLDFGTRDASFLLRFENGQRPSSPLVATLKAMGTAVRIAHSEWFVERNYVPKAPLETVLSIIIGT